MPIVVPLESVAVPTQVPVAADVPVPVGLLGLVATVVGPAGVDVLPLHAAAVTAVKRVNDAINVRTWISMFVQAAVCPYLQ